MGRTHGEPNEIDLTAIGVKVDGSRRVPRIIRRPRGILMPTHRSTVRISLRVLVWLAVGGARVDPASRVTSTRLPTPHVPVPTHGDIESVRGCTTQGASVAVVWRS